MDRYWCECQKCGDKLVSKATWYRHNKQRVHHNVAYLYSASASAETGNGCTPGTPLSPPSDFYVKEFSPEDIDIDPEADVSQASRSDPVGAVC